MYLDALETLEGVRLHYGHYLAKTRQCPRCRATWQVFEEKMTDVNIAVELLGEANPKFQRQSQRKSLSGQKMS